MTKYRVHYCLSNETQFHQAHPLYDSKREELILDLDTIVKLVERCLTKLDNVSVCFSAKNRDHEGRKNSDFLSRLFKSNPRKFPQDCLVIHGLDGNYFDIEYEINGLEGSFHKKKVEYMEVLAVLDNPCKPIREFDANGYKFKDWYS